MVKPLFGRIQVLLSRVAAAALALAVVAVGLVAVASPASASGLPSISGHVYLPAGAPTSWYQQIVVWAKESGNDYNPELGNTVDSQGDYTIAGLAATDYTVRVDLTGTWNSGLGYLEYPDLMRPLPVSVANTNAGTTGVDFTLLSGTSVSGHVTLPAGSPTDWYQGITATATNEDGDEVSADVNSSGGYAIPALAAGQYTVAMDVHSFNDSATGTDVRPNVLGANTPADTSGGSQQGVDFTLASGTVVSGHVTLPPGSNTDWYQGLTIHASDGSIDIDAGVSETGNYTIAGLTAGTYAVSATVGTYFDFASLTNLYPNLLNSAAVTVDTSTGDKTNVGITLTAGTIIAGHVTLPVGSDSSWYQELTVCVKAATEPDRCGHVDFNGNYSFSGLPSGIYTANVTVTTHWGTADANETRPNLVDSAVITVNTTTGNKTSTNFTVKAGTIISGHITLPAGAPTAWYDAMTLRLSDAHGHTADAYVYNNGNYSFVGLPVGKYSVDLDVNFYWDYDLNDAVHPNVVDGLTINADTATGNKTASNFVLKTGTTISGHIALPVGESTDSYMAVWVEASGPADYEYAFVDASGNYRITGLAPGTYSVSVGVDSYSSDGTGPDVYPDLAGGAPLTVNTATGNKAGINFTLAHGSSISGHVSLPDGSPAAWYQGVTVEASIGSQDLTAQVDSDGNFAFTRLGAGAVVVSVAVDSYWDADLGAAVLPNVASSPQVTATTTSGNETVVNFALDPGASVSGTVTGDTEDLAFVVATDLDGTYVGSTQLAQGHTDFSIPALPPGNYRLLAAFDHSDGTEFAVQFMRSQDGTAQWSVDADSPVSGLNMVAATHTASISGTLTTAGFTGYTTSYRYPDYLADAYLYQYFDGSWVKFPASAFAGVTANGAFPYSFTGLSAGTYKVGFDESPSPYTANGAIKQQWYNGKSSLVLADSITLADGTDRAGINGAVSPVSAAVNSFTTAPVPTISGIPTPGSTLTAVPGTWLPAATTLAYQWFRGGVAIPGATTSLYKVLPTDLGTSLTVRVTATKVGYFTTPVLSAKTVVVGPFAAAPVPTITGDPSAGSTLTAIPGTWAPVADLTFQWLRNGVAIPGATASEFELAAADRGKAITVRVTGTAPGYLATAKVSAALAVPLVFTATPTPTISGTPIPGAILTAHPGIWAPAATTLYYQWFRDGVAITTGGGATSYKVLTTDVGVPLSVRVTAAKAGYRSTPVFSADAVVVLPFVSAPVPTITGTATAGSTLTAHPGTWTPAADLTFQWLRAGVVIPDATDATYVVTAADRGKALTVRVTGEASGYLTTAKTSVPLAVPLVFTTTPTPTIAGVATVGSTLTAVPGVWAPLPTTLAYQWFRGGTAITGATTTTYKVVASDLDLPISVRVTAVRAGYLTTPLVSNPTTAVRTFTSAPVPTITGTATAGSTLTANPGTWAPAANLTFQWLRAGVAIPGATAATYELTADDRGKAITVRVTGTAAGYLPTARVSAALAVPSVFTTAPTPVIVGSPIPGAILTAVPGVWAPTATTLSYQWFRDGTAITGATTTTYKVLATDLDKSLTVRVTASKAGYVTAPMLSNPTTVVRPFTATPVPTITGTATAGSTLTANPGTWSPAADLAFQWLRAGVAIPGATASTYELTAADRGKAITVRVTGTAAGYLPTAKVSAALAVPSVFTTTPTPTIAGTPIPGAILTAVPGTWAPLATTLAYQWLLDGTAITGATTTTYKVLPTDLDKSLTVRVTAVRAGYLTTPMVSNPTTVVRPFTATPVPTITGAATAGSTLAANPGTWTPAADLTFQWLRAGVAIPGATAATYELTAADRGKAITVRVTGTAAGYLATAKVSAALAVPLVFTTTPTPTIAGTPIPGAILTAVPGTWAPLATSLAYQWFRDGTAITGASTTTYKVLPTDLDKSLTVRITAVKAGYLTTPIVSNPTTPVRTFTSAPVPTIAGTATAGSTLTANPGAWAPAATLTFQWLRAGVVIPGASDATYVLTATDRGKAITVRVTGTAAGYLTTAKTSAALAIPLVFTTTPTPTIAGVPTVGATLTAVPGTWAPLATTLSYQWFRDGVAISGGTISTYKVLPTDLDKSLTVRVTAVRAGYLTTPMVSNPTTPARTFTTAPIPAITGTATAGSTLTANPGVWTPAANLTFQWLRAGAAIPGATASTYQLTTADRGKAITVRVTGTAAGYLPTAKVSAALAVPLVFTTTPTPTIAGVPTVGATLTAVPGIWAPLATTLAYQWLRDGTAITGATTTTYKVLPTDLDKALTVRVTAVKAGYLTTPMVSNPATAVRTFTSAPVPTITGTATAGSTLTANPGTWAPAANLTFQWLRAGVAIPGATAATYELTAADRGKAITVRVTGTAAGYLATAKTSAALAIPSVFTTAPTPTIAGVPIPGAILTAVPGTWVPVPTTQTYQWFRDGVRIPGANLTTYKVLPADVGTSLTVRIISDKVGFLSAAVVSGPAPVVRPFTATPIPTISGTATEGSTLTVSPGAWAPAPDFTFQWLRAGVAIPDATNASYDLTAADSGKAITVKVTGATTGYLTTAKTSAAVHVPVTS